MNYSLWFLVENVCCKKNLKNFLFYIQASARADSKRGSLCAYAEDDNRRFRDDIRCQSPGPLLLDLFAVGQASRVGAQPPRRCFVRFSQENRSMFALSEIVVT